MNNINNKNNINKTSWGWARPSSSSVEFEFKMNCLNRLNWWTIELTIRWIYDLIYETMNEVLYEYDENQQNVD